MRIVTYNIRGGLGTDNIRSIERIVEVLRELEPDIVCLQEVHQRLPWSGFVDQPGRIANSLSFKAVFQSNYRVGIGSFGNCIMTRFPIASKESIRLPNPRERRSILRYPERRGLQKIVVDLPERKLTVFNTHWSLDRQDRLESSKMVARAVTGLTMPAIMTGDFNAAADSEEIQGVRAASSLVDAGAGQGFLTFTSDNPSTRIDYVWISAEIQINSINVMNTQASDHLPVIVDFEL